MAVRVKCTTSKSQIQNYSQKRLEIMQLKVVNSLIKIGEQVIDVVRRYADYDNYTGNLRTSSRFGVVSGGKLIYTSRVDMVLPTAIDAYRVSERLLKDIASRRPYCDKKTTALIVVAGMHYASIVSDNGRDVLDSGYLIAKNLISRMFK